MLKLLKTAFKHRDATVAYPAKPMQVDPNFRGKPEYNPEQCIACGACGAVAPDIFGYDDEGYAENIFEGDANTGTKEIADNLEADLIDAAEGCPTEAIKVQDSPFN